MASRGSTFARTCPIGHELLPDPETTAERLEILGLLAQEKRVGHLSFTAPNGSRTFPLIFYRFSNSFAKGDRVILLKAGEKLVDAGYERVAQVAIRGQFAIRGGIMDVFSWHASLPMRIEWDDEFVDSIRRFDPDSQMSIGEATSCEILPGNSDAKLVLFEIHSKEDLIIDVEAGEQTPAIRISADSGEDAKAFFPQPLGKFDAGDLVLDSARRERLFRQLEEWRIAGWLVALAAGSEGERAVRGTCRRRALRSFIDQLPAATPISRGSCSPRHDLPCFPMPSCSAAPRRCASNVSPTAVNACWPLVQQSISRSSNLGIMWCIWSMGLVATRACRRCLMIVGQRFSAWNTPRARLYVPLDQAWQVARYVGVGKRHPELSELGDGRGGRARERKLGAQYLTTPLVCCAFRPNAMPAPGFHSDRTRTGKGVRGCFSV